MRKANIILRKQKIKSSNSKGIISQYRILGLLPGAGLKGVENAFRKLALKYHPDRCAERNKNICKEKFISVCNARDVIRDYILTGKIRMADRRKLRKNLKIYRDHIEMLKRFYDDWLGDLSL